MSDDLNANARPPYATLPEDDGEDFFQLVTPLAERWRRVIGIPVAATLLTFGATYLMTPIFTATTVFLPPQTSQGGASAALASLGSLASLAGGSSAIKSPVDQYVALLQSRTVSDRIIERFDLMKVYEVDLHDKARKELAKHVAIAAGKKDGLITVDVDDKSPALAASIANQYVEELRHLTQVLAITEAQQRRVFFDKQLQETKVKLTAAQTALQQSGFNAGAIKTEPKAAADAYAKLRAELTAGEVRLQILRQRLADTSTEVQQQLTLVQALREQLARLEGQGNADAAAAPDAAASASGPASADYITKYREFKYQETLFDLFARQYELAKADESKDGALVQVVDTAVAPERKSKPKRTYMALGVGLFVGVVYALKVLAQGRVRRDAEFAAKLAALRAAMRRKG